MRIEGEEHLVALLQTEHKKGKVWVLPKGHVELHKNESIDQAAKREVEEEAGLKDLEVRDLLGTTQFVFQAEDAVVRKTVHYYLMLTKQTKLVPQVEEHLLDAQWFPIARAIKQLEYDTDQEIVMKAGQKLGLDLKVPRLTAGTRNGRSRDRRTPRIHS